MAGTARVCRRVCGAALLLGIMALTLGRGASAAETDAGVSVWTSEPGPGQTVEVGQDIRFTLTFGAPLGANDTAAVRIKYAPGLLCSKESVEFLPLPSSGHKLINVAMGQGEFVVLTTGIQAGEGLCFSAEVTGRGDISCTLISGAEETAYTLYVLAQHVQQPASQTASAQTQDGASTAAAAASPLQTPQPEGGNLSHGLRRVVEAYGDDRRFIALTVCIVGVVLCLIWIVSLGRRLSGGGSKRRQ